MNADDQKNEALREPTPVLRGVLKRPRTVLLGNWTDSEREKFRQIVGHVWHFESAADLTRDVTQDEVDLIVLRSAPPAGDLWNQRRPACSIVFFPTDTTEEFVPFYLRERSPSKYRQFEVNPNAGELGQLMRRATESLQDAVGLPRWREPGTRNSVGPFHVGSEWLARTPDGASFAFNDISELRYSDPPAVGLLVVPDVLCADVSYWEWTVAAMRRWQQEHPDAFPQIRDWKEDPAWLSAKESELNRQLEALDIERKQALAQFNERASKLREELRAESARADREERRLLTSQAEDLVEAVSAVFSELGFTVSVPEEETSTARAEDLLLTRTDWKDWKASVEVKGFEKTGVKIVHVVKLSKRRDRRKADQAILVVNSEFGKQPPSRNSPFSNNNDALESVAELDVLVVDTRELFQALNGRIPRRHFLKSIRGESGVFSFQEEGT